MSYHIVVLVIHVMFVIFLLVHCMPWLVRLGRQLRVRLDRRLKVGNMNKLRQPRLTAKQLPKDCTNKSKIPDHPEEHAPGMQGAGQQETKSCKLQRANQGPWPNRLAKTKITKSSLEWKPSPLVPELLQGHHAGPQQEASWPSSMCAEAANDMESVSPALADPMDTESAASPPARALAEKPLAPMHQEEKKGAASSVSSEQITAGYGDGVLEKGWGGHPGTWPTSRSPTAARHPGKQHPGQAGHTAHKGASPRPGHPFQQKALSGKGQAGACPSPTQPFADSAPSPTPITAIPHAL